MIVYRKYLISTKKGKFLRGTIGTFIMRLFQCFSVFDSTYCREAYLKPCQISKMERFANPP